jgi:transcriptional regulator with XRE-family HTH domain
VLEDAHGGRYLEGKPAMLAILAEARADDEVAHKIYALRTKAGLTQGQLAKRVGTTAAAIRQLEAADYDGNALAMLRWLAEALGKRVEIRCVAAKNKQQRA